MQFDYCCLFWILRVLSSGSLHWANCPMVTCSSKWFVCILFFKLLISRYTNQILSCFFLPSNTTSDVVILWCSSIHQTALEKGKLSIDNEKIPHSSLQIDVKFITKKDLQASNIIDPELIKNSTKKSSSKRNTLSESSSCDFKKKKQDNNSASQQLQQELIQQEPQLSQQEPDSNGV